MVVGVGSVVVGLEVVDVRVVEFEDVGVKFVDLSL